MEKQGGRLRDKPLVQRFLRSNYVSLSGIVCLIVTFAIVVNVNNNSFLSSANIINIMRQIVVYGILSCALAFPMINGAFDLSISSTAALSGVLTATIVVSGIGGVQLPFSVAAVLAILICCVVGFVNGIIISKTTIPPFIVTLGTQTAVRGVVYLISNNKPIGNLPASFQFLGFGFWFGIPVSIFIMIAIFMLVAFVLKQTTFGRSVYANGGNYQAAYLSGINTVRVRTLAYIISAALSAIAGILLAARNGSAQPTAANTYETIAISACAMGGVSLSGGQGTVIGIFLGSLMMGMITNGMNLLYISANWQYVVRGVLIIASVFYSLWISKRASRV